MTSQLLFDLEKDIADFLLTKLEHKEMTIERAATISKFVLKSLPDNLSEEQLKQIMSKLDEKFIELSLIVHKHMLEYEEKQKQKLVNEAITLIHQHNLNKASQLMNGYFLKKI